MAYKLQKQDLLTGGLNLIAPVDKLDEAHAVCSHNWRVDQLGALRSRKQDWPRQSTSGAAHSIFVAKIGGNPVVFYGAGTSFYRADVVPCATGFDGYPLGMTFWQGYLWVMNRSKQGRHAGGSLDPFASWFGTAAPAAPPTAAPQVGGALEVGQNYSYYVTFLTAAGEETNPSAPVQVTIADPNRWIRITRPASTDPAVTKWNLYRIGNTLPDAYRLNTDPIDIAATTFDDSGDPADGLGDLAVVQLGIALQTDRDAPPAARGLVGPYYNRLVAFSTAAHPNWIFWTPINQPYCFPGSGLAEGNHAPVGDEGEEIVAVVQHPRYLLIYKEHSIWRLSGDCETGILEKVRGDVGLLGRKAIASGGAIDYFQTAEGICACDGESVKKLTAALDPIFRYDTVTIDGAYPATPVNAAYRQEAAIGYRNGRLWYSYADQNNTHNNTTLVCDVQQGAWHSDSRPFNCFFDEGQNGEFLGAIWGLGAIYTLEVAFAKPTTLMYQSGFHDQGSRDRQKQYCDVVVEHSEQGVAGLGIDVGLTVAVKYDNGASGDAIGTIFTAKDGAAYVKRTRSIFPIPLNGTGKKARNLAVRLEDATGAAGAYDTSIYSVELHYYPLPRDAKTFDSGETNLGFEGVKEIDALELDIDSDGAVQWTFWSNVPGGTLSQREQHSFAATAGRTPVVIPLTGIDGRLVRFTLRALDSTFRLWGARIRHRQIGVYRDGGAGEIFETPPIGVGI